MRFTLPLLTAAVMAFAGAAQAATLSFGFDGSADGWTLIDDAKDRNGTQNELTAVASGGVTGGYLQVKDKTGGYMALVAPAALNGDLSAFHKGRLSFHLADLTTKKARAVPTFGQVSITGAGRTVKVDPFAGTVGPDFERATITLTGGAFGIDDAAFAAILADVTDFRISLESRFGLVETVAIDDFEISAVPLPAGGLLLLTGLGAIAVARRRKAA
ncbi:MAG: VPLPA-CTERM sorting domain-containing protein [Pseudomonadota bacterium]